MCGFHRPTWRGLQSLYRGVSFQRQAHGDGNGRARTRHRDRAPRRATSNARSGGRRWLCGNASWLSRSAKDPSSKVPIVVSAIAVFVGLFSNAVSDWITKDRRLAEETRQREAALLVKAFEHNDPNVVMAKLNLLNLTGMISDANELAKKLAGQEYTEIESKIKSLPSEIASTISGRVDPKGDRERRRRQGAEEAEASGRGQPHSRLRQGSQSLCNAQHDGRASGAAADIVGGVHLHQSQVRRIRQLFRFDAGRHDADDR